MLVLTAVTPAIVQAQANGVAAIAASCRTAAMDWYVRQTNAAVNAASKPGGAPPDAIRLLAARDDRQRACLLKIDLTAVSGSGLAPLAKAYSSVGLDSLAFVAATRRLGEVQGQSDGERASALNGVIAALATAQPRTLARAETYVTMLDALADTVSVGKISGHRAMKNAYVKLGDVARVRYHAGAIIALGKSREMRSLFVRGPAIYQPILDAYMDIVRGFEEAGQTDAALAELSQIGKDHPELGGATLDSLITPTRARLELIGKPAAAIVAAHWLNVDSATHSVLPKGKVTVIAFSATWCAACKPAYPVLNTLATRFPVADLGLVLVTELYGRGADELASDRQFFVGKHELRFPIAIADRPRRNSADTIPASSNALQYAVYAIPQIVVIDRQGIIRRVMVGWEAGDERRLEAIVTALVAERR